MPIVPVDDPLDARLHDFRAVPDPVLFRRRGLFVAESRFVVRELLAHPPADRAIAARDPGRPSPASATSSTTALSTPCQCTWPHPPC